MDKILCILVDDEESVLHSLEYSLKKYFPQFEIVGTAASVSEATVIIKEKRPHVVFLDIIMPVESGFQLIKKFESIDFEIVFVTSHAEYALEAIQNLALAYLLKPVDIDDLKKVVEHLELKLELKEKKLLYDTLLENLNQKNTSEQQIAIHTSGRTDFIKISDIIRVEGWNRYTKIFGTNSRVYVSSYAIGKYISLLEKYNFFVVHKSHVINMDHIKLLSGDDKLLMSDQSIVPISVRKKQEFLEKFESVKR